MTKGGARNKSGPGVNPNSLRSAERGVVLTALPSGGYGGEVPEFPIPAQRIFRWEFEDKRRFQVFDADETEWFRERELALWADRWTTPQACAWALEPWRWYMIAMWVRTAVVCEGPNATAADKGSIHRFADQIGLTPAGLKENGWAIAHDETAEKRGAAPKRASARDRLKVVDGSVG